MDSQGLETRNGPSETKGSQNPTTYTYDACGRTLTETDPDDKLADIKKPWKIASMKYWGLASPGCSWFRDHWISAAKEMVVGGSKVAYAFSY